MKIEITGEAVMNNRDYNGETVVVFEAMAIDDNGRECVAVWDDPDWGKANGEDFSMCCDFDNPDEIIYTGVE